jgi:hypothetical protein
MRVMLAILALIFATAVAGAQQSNPSPDTSARDKSSSDSSHSTGRSSSPSTRGQAQPQGHTGPLNTTSGGAPPESPQGQTPPGMQSAPAGSDKTIVDEKK